MMSAERWELVTWDLMEREIVECLLLANGRPEKPGPLTTLLAKALKAASVPGKDTKSPRGSSSNG